jgi:hypothetical protein
MRYWKSSTSSWIWPLQRKGKETVWQRTLVSEHHYTEPKFEGNIPWKELTPDEKSHVVNQMRIHTHPTFHVGMLPFLSRQTLYSTLRGALVSRTVKDWPPIWQDIYHKVFPDMKNHYQP